MWQGKLIKKLQEEALEDPYSETGQILFYELILEKSFFPDELSGILKKLSLEKYHPIFEEQEVLALSFETLRWKLKNNFVNICRKYFGT